VEIQELEVFISPEGKISFEVRGLPGRKCLDLTKGLEMDLGGEILSREETSEMTRDQVNATIAQKQQTRS
jgi:hypothetical protein